MLFGTLPISVFASTTAKSTATSALPYVTVSSLYFYDEGNSGEFRALPDMEGNFYLDIALSEAPSSGEEIVVYYRTQDNSAVAAWGDYENVGEPEEAFVILNKANSYKSRVVIRSALMDYGFVTSDNAGKRNSDKLVTRRFLFELTRVEGNAELHTPKSGERNQSWIYCYLRALGYSYQDVSGKVNTAAWQTGMEAAYRAKMDKELDYLWESDPSFGPMHAAQFRDEVNAKWSDGTKNIKYTTCYYSTDSASYLNTPHIKYGGVHTDSVNLKFNDDWYNYIASGVCDLGISINGRLVSEYWDSSGDATFHLYYYYQGEKKIALSLYLEGEFDDSKFFGWEHAFEYAVEGLTGNNRDDHMDENFIGFTLYDNDGKVAYEVKAHSRSETDEVVLCEDLKRTLKTEYAVELMAEYNELTNYNDNFTAYYLKLPTNFALADSYSYELILEKAREKEIRWLENVNLTFALMSNQTPMIAKDASGNQMVATNLETMKEGDPLRMSIRFDRPVYASNSNTYITADIYNDKGACLAKGLQLKLKKAGDYAWDTLVFECELPSGLDGTKIASLRNITISDENGPIKGFFTDINLAGKTIKTIYIDRDLRVPEAKLGTSVSDNWMKSRSIDVCVNVQGSSARFNDYVTVYYQWSGSQTTPKTYSSRVTFNTKVDGEVMKSIIGTGNGETYLHMKAVSSYGKSSTTMFGPFKFDNMPPELTEEDIIVTGTLKEPQITIPLPDDHGGTGMKDISLYYVDKNGEGQLLKTFGEDQFTGDPKALTYTVSHRDVKVGVDPEDDAKIVLERREVILYWVITDKLGNTTGRTADFTAVFDTNNYLDEEIEAVGPYDISDLSGHAQFKKTTSSIDDQTLIYNYRSNKGKTYDSYAGETVYYAFSFKIKDGAFGPTDSGTYAANVSYKGVAVDSASYSVVEVSSGVWAVFLHTETGSGRYDIQLTRQEGESLRGSRIFSVYATDGEADETAIKTQISTGTLLSNSVYQLSTEYPYFYYKDTNGTTQKVHYNNTKQPATFSTLAKAKEYVYYMELSDICLVELTATTANALSSGTAGYLLAKGETMVPKEGQYWIRYKSEAWTPTSGDSSWVYYYYGTDKDLTEGALSTNLQAALNAVANRIVNYGKSVVLTDTSLFLGSAQGDKMLDGYGMPYLAPGQIHSTDELSAKTMCENEWTSHVAFAADKNIYKSSIYVGTEGTPDYTEYPIVGSFLLPADSRFQYMTYEQYKTYEENGRVNPAWNPLNVKNGESFINVFSSSGVYYIREISADGVSVYAIYIDKEAPKVSFSHTDDKGAMKEIPVDGVQIHEIRTKDLYIGSISAVEYDRLSYVAVYKVANLALVGIYTASELDLAPIQLEDGNYYIVVADRSGNHYTVTAKVSMTDLECTLKEYTDRYIRLTCNRRNDQILRYEVKLNGELVTSTYVAEQTFDKAGLYTVYIQDIYGNEYVAEHLFSRNYPTVTWKYLGTDGKYHAYDPKDTNANGFVLTWVTDNQYKISTAVKTRFSFGGDYGYEFVGTAPKFTETLGTETSVTIEEGQSFTLKVYYKNHKDCYSIYSGVVDVTPPSINVSAEVDMVENAEYSLFDEWAKGNVGDVITMNKLYYVLSEISRKTVENGGSVTSDSIKISASDANDLSLVEVYLDGELIKTQDVTTGFSQISVSKAGNYRIMAKDTLGNISEFVFKNGMPDSLSYFVDGVEKEPELHGYLHFNASNEYTKVDYGNTSFLLNIKQQADVFLDVGVTDGNRQISGFRVSDGKVYPLTYTVVLDENGNKAIELMAGKAVLDMTAEDFKENKDYLISKEGNYAIYASIGLDQVVSIKVYAPQDTTKVVKVSARIEFDGSCTMFVSSEISKKGSVISLEGLGAQTSSEIRVNDGFVVDESVFESERIASIRLYFSKLNDLTLQSLSGRTNIYTADQLYDNEGFYLLIVRNLYGNEKVYRIAISRSFGVTSSVTFGDGHKIYYSKDYDGTLYSNGEITLDILDEGVTFTATRNGAAYTKFAQRQEEGMTYISFSEEGAYTVSLTDPYGNTVTRTLEINKSAYSVAEELLVGYNEKALKRDEGYTNQALSIDKAIYDREGIYYLAIRYGDTLTVLYDSFAETPVAADAQALVGAVGALGDGVYQVICRNRYGAVVTKEIHYRSTPTLKLERTTRSKSEVEVYDLSHALSLGFWSNNTLNFSTEATTYVFTVNGDTTECPRTLVFENAGDYGSFEYDITYVDEYGFEYSFKAHLVRKDVTVNVPASITGIEIDGVLNTKNDISVTFGENTYATYTLNNGEAVAYRSGDVLKKDGTYRFTVMDYAGNTTGHTIKKDTAVEFSFTELASGNTIQSGSVVNSSRVNLNVLNKDSAYIEMVLLNGVVQKDFTGERFSEDGKWEIILADQLGNTAYFSFYIVTRSQNGFAYTTPYEYHITEMWYDGGDGVKVSYMDFVNRNEYTSDFFFKENGVYSVVMVSDVTGLASTFAFTVNTNASAATLVGCADGETTINDVTVTGCKVGDRIRIYRITDRGEELIERIEVTTLATKMPTITEGGKYRIVFESEAGVATEVTFVRKHVMNTAGSIFVMVVIGLAVVGLFTGLIYRNKSKTDD